MNNCYYILLLLKDSKKRRNSTIAKLFLGIFNIFDAANRAVTRHGAIRCHATATER